MKIIAAPLISGAAVAADLKPDQVAFHSLYKELVETNTTLSAGNCTEATARMQRRLKDARYPNQDLYPFGDPALPKEGGLVAWLPGSTRAKSHPAVSAYRCRRG